RHEVLRTTFATVTGQPIQVIGEPQPVPLPVIDLQALPDEDREMEAVRLAFEEARQPFDLVHGPLMRTTLLHLGPYEHIILLTMHHIVSDGWSAEVFMRELVRFYTAYVRGQPASLPELPIQYADYAVWQRHWLQGAVLEEQLAYWRQQLA